MAKTSCGSRKGKRALLHTSRDQLRTRLDLTLKTNSTAPACGSVPGLYSTWVTLRWVGAQEAPAAAWPQPGAGAQTHGSGTMDCPKRGSHVLGRAGPDFQAGFWWRFPPPCPVPKDGILASLRLASLEEQDWDTKVPDWCLFIKEK